MCTDEEFHLSGSKGWVWWGKNCVLKNLKELSAFDILYSLSQLHRLQESAAIHLLLTKILSLFGK